METSITRAVAAEGDGSAGLGAGADVLLGWKSRLKNVIG